MTFMTDNYEIIRKHMQEYKIDIVTDCGAYINAYNTLEQKNNLCILNIQKEKESSKSIKRDTIKNYHIIIKHLVDLANFLHSKGYSLGKGLGLNLSEEEEKSYFTTNIANHRLGFIRNYLEDKDSKYFCGIGVMAGKLTTMDEEYLGDVHLCVNEQGQIMDEVLDTNFGEIKFGWFEEGIDTFIKEIDKFVIRFYKYAYSILKNKRDELAKNLDILHSLECH